MIAETCPTFVPYLLWAEAALADSGSTPWAVQRCSKTGASALLEHRFLHIMFWPGWPKAKGLLLTGVLAQERNCSSPEGLFEGSLIPHISSLATQRSCAALSMKGYWLFVAIKILKLPFSSVGSHQIAVSACQPPVSLIRQMVRSGSTPGETEKWQSLAHEAVPHEAGSTSRENMLCPQHAPGLNGALLGLCANWPRWLSQTALCASPGGTSASIAGTWLSCLFGTGLKAALLFLRILASHTSKLHPVAGMNRRVVAYPAVTAVLWDVVHAWDPVTKPALLLLSYEVCLGPACPKSPTALAQQHGRALCMAMQSWRGVIFCSDGSQVSQLIEVHIWQVWKLSITSGTGEKGKVFAGRSICYCLSKNTELLIRCLSLHGVSSKQMQAGSSKAGSFTD